ncbi:hypothetical protein BCV70DRAFT_197057 [Testicularia cyperi]|uniref:GTP-binding protein n=1 Tax=Testicularia cyperi TaxID=1882483 RepID=A0A317XWU9_9BASI|nr:hypothetical protein BCV70DRAFT_197057 [Testicularia cyperi]
MRNTHLRSAESHEAFVSSASDYHHPPRPPPTQSTGHDAKMKRKVLLMGQSGCGKTSMRSFIFSAYRAADTRRLGSTLDVEHSHVRFLGNLVLNLWDCGGQQSYMDSYLDKQRSQVFSTVGVLIYVFDLVSAEGEEDGHDQWERDLRYYKDCISALYQYSPDAQVFCLLHKMDLVDKTRRASVYSSRVKELRRKSREVAQAASSRPVTGFRINCFATSIWDESLYRAWSRIVQTQIPSLETLERHLEQFADSCAANEVVLFERTTFLIIAKAAGSSTSSSATATSSKQSVARRSDGSNPNRAAGGTGSGDDFVYDEDEEGMEGFRDTQGRSTTTALGSGFITSTQSNLHTDVTSDNPFVHTTTTSSSSAASSLTPMATRPGSGSGLDPERFEKVSQLIKDFKLCCQRLPAKTSTCEFVAVELRAPNFTAYIDSLTSNTYILVMCADPRIQMASIKLNLQLARDHFERLQAVNPRQ